MARADRSSPLTRDWQTQPTGFVRRAGFNTSCPRSVKALDPADPHGDGKLRRVACRFHGGPPYSVDRVVPSGHADDERATSPVGYRPERADPDRLPSDAPPSYDTRASRAPHALHSGLGWDSRSSTRAATSRPKWGRWPKPPHPTQSLVSCAQDAPPFRGRVSDLLRTAGQVRQ